MILGWAGGKGGFPEFADGGQPIGGSLWQPVKGGLRGADSGNPWGSLGNP